MQSTWNTISQMWYSSSYRFNTQRIFDCNTWYISQRHAIFQNELFTSHSGRSVWKQMWSERFGVLDSPIFARSPTLSNTTLNQVLDGWPVPVRFVKEVGGIEVCAKTLLSLLINLSTPWISGEILSNCCCELPYFGGVFKSQWSWCYRRL
jgi:hypothetical protein